MDDEKLPDVSCGRPVTHAISWGVDPKGTAKVAHAKLTMVVHPVEGSIVLGFCEALNSPPAVVGEFAGAWWSPNVWKECGVPTADDQIAAGKMTREDYEAYRSGYKESKARRAGQAPRKPVDYCNRDKEQPHRREDHWRAASAIALDFDWTDKDQTGKAAHKALPCEVAKWVAQAGGRPGNIVHTTPRGVRIVYVLNEPCTDLQIFKAAVAGAFADGAKWLEAMDWSHQPGVRDGLALDASARDPSRILWAPTVVAGPKARSASALVVRNEPYSIDALLALSPGPARVTALEGGLSAATPCASTTGLSQGPDRMQQAVQQFNIDHQERYGAYPASGTGDCPVCKGTGGWGALPQDPTRWYCWHRGHVERAGGVVIGNRRDEASPGYYGDALDLYIWHRYGGTRSSADRASVLMETMRPGGAGTYLSKTGAGAGRGEQDVRAGLTAALENWLPLAKSDPTAAMRAARADSTLLCAVGMYARESQGSFANLRDEMNARKSGPSKSDLKEFTKIAVREWDRLAGASRANQASSLLPQEHEDCRAVVQINQQLAPVVDQGAEALMAANVPPTLFVQHNRIVRVGSGDLGPSIEAVDAGALAYKLSEAARWCKVEGGVDEQGNCTERRMDAYPPTAVVSALLSTPPPNMPALRAVRSTPFFTREGELVLVPGYHPVAKAVLLKNPKLNVPCVSRIPTSEEVNRAKSLLDEMVADFPFVADADRAHYMALVIEPFVKPMVFGQNPAHVIEAPEAGTGKSLLGDLAAIIATGEKMPWRALPVREEEREKTVISALLSGSPYVAFDNVKGTVDSPTLESALTTRFFTGRFLGMSKDVHPENNASWPIALNNGQLTRDLGRRAVRTRIDAMIARPETRTQYRHPNLGAWVTSHRGEIVHAVLTIVQHWIAKSRPAFSGKSKASFESWSEVLGGIIETAGWTGFLAPEVEAAMTRTDERRNEAEEFVQKWWETFGTDEVMARELLRLAAPPETYKDAFDTVQERPAREPTYLSGLLGGGAVGTRVNRMAAWLSSNMHRILAEKRIVEGREDLKNKIKRYRLEPVSDGREKVVAPSSGLAVPSRAHAALEREQVLACGSPIVADTF